MGKLKIVLEILSDIGYRLSNECASLITFTRGIRTRISNNSIIQHTPVTVVVVDDDGLWCLPCHRRVVITLLVCTEREVL